MHNCYFMLQNQLQVVTRPEGKKYFSIIFRSDFHALFLASFQINRIHWHLFRTMTIQIPLIAHDILIKDKFNLTTMSFGNPFKLYLFRGNATSIDVWIIMNGKRIHPQNIPVNWDSQFGNHQLKSWNFTKNPLECINTFFLVTMQTSGWVLRGGYQRSNFCQIIMPNYRIFSALSSQVQSTWKLPLDELIAKLFVANT